MTICLLNTLHSVINADALLVAVYCITFINLSKYICMYYGVWNKATLLLTKFPQNKKSPAIEDMTMRNNCWRISRQLMDLSFWN